MNIHFKTNILSLYWIKVIFSTNSNYINLNNLNNSNKYLNCNQPHNNSNNNNNKCNNKIAFMKKILKSP